MDRLRSKVDILLLVAASSLIAAIMPSSASAADVRNSHDVRYYSNPKPLLNSVKQTLHGDKKGGTCIWHPPGLTLKKGQRAVEARQVSADYTACTTVVEIGTPTEIDPLDPGEVVGTEPGGFASGADRHTARISRIPGATKPLSAAAYTNSQAYYKVTWLDWPGFTVNYVRSILNWTWGNNECIVGSTQSWATYAQSGTGWTLSSLSAWKDTYCDSHYGHVSADFSNYIFCVPPTYVHYRDVRIRGGYQGGYGAYLGSTWADGDCFPLHWSAQLVKEW